jgi:periplasmic glucans biosynthesis protein
MSATHWPFDRNRAGRLVALLCALAVGALAVVPPAQADPLASTAGFDARTVIEVARTLAAQPYRAPGRERALPPALRALDYDAHRAIRFDPQRALWRGAGRFEIQFFHLGWLFAEPVRVHVVDAGQASELAFDATRFRYDPPVEALADALPDDLGWAGFRVHFPLHRPEYADEFLVFLGASYFRVVGRDQGYGLSARGLAIDTARPGGEEFPAFRAFWIERPEPLARELVIHALLDSPSVTGAYRFVARPGAQTTLEVEAVLFARETVERIGLAPLTSMYAHGDTSVGRGDDYRPRVHDSDGLLVRTSSGEWIWRPLSNPPRLREFSLIDSAPSSFGLLQRERDFERYLDAEARYERRPGKWVEPLSGDWGGGQVVLVEIPTESEIHDNIVAFWQPAQPLRAGEEWRLHYRLATVGARVPSETLARVVRTRHGWGALPGDGHPPPEALRHVSVAFRGGELASLAASQPVQVRLEASSGGIDALRLLKLDDGETWLVSFLLAPEPDRVADLRLWLELHGEVLSETWSFAWEPGTVHGR